MEASEYVTLFNRLHKGSGAQMALLIKSLKYEQGDLWTFKLKEDDLTFTAKGAFDVFVHLYTNKDPRLILLLILLDSDTETIMEILISLALED